MGFDVCYDTNRSQLADRIPLKNSTIFNNYPLQQPAFLSVSIAPHSLSPEILGKRNFIKKSMRWVTFVTIIDQIQEFDDKLKAIHFQGMGEPLLNKNFVEKWWHMQKKRVLLKN